MRDDRFDIPRDSTGPAQGSPGRIPDHLVDRFFDRELTRAESASLFEALRSDPAAAREIVGTQRAIDALRQPLKTPDLSRSILARVDRHSPLLTRRSVRHVRVGRLVSAACLLLIIAGAFIAQRTHPQVVNLGGERPAPVADLASNLSGDTADAVNTLRQTARAVTVTALSQASPASAAAGQASADPQSVFVRARFIPETLFPWRAQSGPPANEAIRHTAWIVPCSATGHCSAGTLNASASGAGSQFILVDFKVNADATDQIASGSLGAPSRDRGK